MNLDFHQQNLLCITPSYLSLTSWLNKLVPSGIVRLLQYIFGLSELTSDIKHISKISNFVHNYLLTYRQVRLIHFEGNPSLGLF